MKKLLFKVFNYIMFFIFILSVCGLDSEKFWIPAISTLISGLYLFIVYKIDEAKEMRGVK